MREGIRTLWIALNIAILMGTAAEAAAATATPASLVDLEPYGVSSSSDSDITVTESGGLGNDIYEASRIESSDGALTADSTHPVEDIEEEANDASYRPGISSNGQVVAFSSTASNLEPPDAPLTGDVFSHEAGTTQRVSQSSRGVPGGGFTYSPGYVSGNGRFVTFAADGTTLVADDTNGVSDIFVHDRLTEITTRVSVSSLGVQSNRASYVSRISADGRFVAFRSEATNLVSGDTNNATDIFVHDRETASTTRVSLDSSGTQANGPSYSASLSADGRYVAFQSSASNLVPGGTSVVQVFVHDRVTGQTSLASVSSTGQTVPGDWATIMDPSISADGRYVAFTSSLNTLVPNDTNDPWGWDVFVRDRVAGTTTRVSVNSAGAEANAQSTVSAISGDGRYVAFESSATNLAPNDTNDDDVFVHDRVTGNTTIVSVDSQGNQGNGNSGGAGIDISGDGRYVAFDSYASNLVPGDDNGKNDIFVHDMVTGETARVSVATGGLCHRLRESGAWTDCDSPPSAPAQPSPPDEEGACDVADAVNLPNPCTGSFPGGLPRPENMIHQSRGAEDLEPQAPLPTISRYIGTTNPAALYNLGYNLGKGVNEGTRPRNALVILSFGSPRWVGGQPGATFYGGPDSDYHVVRGMVVVYAQGYFDATSQNPSGAARSPLLRIVAGTTNNQLPLTPNGQDRTFEHGATWAQGVVNAGNQQLKDTCPNNGPCLFSRVRIRGGMDIEQNPDDPEGAWGAPGTTKDWLLGYKSTADVTESFFYNFGSADSCPDMKPISQPGQNDSCLGQWGQHDIWQVSWGLYQAAFPFPQIYNFDGKMARQWHWISAHGFKHHGGRKTGTMNFAGAVTQRRACKDYDNKAGGKYAVRCDPDQGAGGEPDPGDTYQEPQRGWQQLLSALNDDPRTVDEGDLKSTDFSWLNF